jgi:hypothetical protein
MLINLTIQAEVIDIRSDTPRQDDIFLADTNVWLWQTYTSSIPSDPRVRAKISIYTSYLKKARVAGAALAYSGLVLAELAHVIEKTEYEIYQQQTGHQLKMKDYRHNYPAERTNVIIEIESSWRQIEQFAVLLELTVNDEVTNAALARFKTQALDGYDLLILETISQAEVGQVKVITDDMDYAVVPGIQVFTNNGSVIQQATVQKKLLTTQ